MGILVSISVASALAQGSSGFWACSTEYSGQRLRVYNWTTYIAEDTIANFERLCGVTVTYNTYGGDDEMLEVIRAGNENGYDLVVPSDSTAALMIAENLLQPITWANVPNRANLGQRFQTLPFDPTGRYTVPYQWGTIGVGYNRTALGRELTTWEQVFDAPEPTAWIDQDRAMFGFALTLLGHDPNTTNPAEIEEARQFLAEHSAQVIEIAPDTGQDLLAAGTADIVIEYSGDIFQLIADCNCDDYAYLIPEEGALIWIDNMGIPVNAANPRLAETFIDYLLSPQVGADISNYTAYASPNQLSIDEGLISGAYLNNPSIYPDEALQARLFFTLSNAETEQLYSNAWNALRAEIGN